MVMNETTTKIFPYLERLLDGEDVEWKTLGDKEYISIENNARKAVNSRSRIPGETPYYGANNIQDYVEGYTHDGVYILIAEDGTASIEQYSIQWAEGKFWANNHVHVIRGTEKINNRFLYYILKTVNFTPFLVGGGRAKLTKAKLQEIPFAVPPLRVQARIVEILDKFTQLEAQLEAELQAELEARRKQYAYYRDQLLDFSQYPSLNVNVEWKTLGEIMEIVTDFTAAGSFASNAQNVRYLQEPNYALLVRTTDIKQGFKATDKFVYVDQHAFEYLWRVNLDKECIILPNVGNCGEVYHSSPSILPYTKCVLGPNAILVRSEKVSNKFLFYLFQAAYFQKELAKITSTVGQGKFNKTNLKQINLPIPPLSEQRRIVDILDRFDTLTNSISEGLPKEIALRRKQYAYYRDALLSFPRPEVSA